MASAIDSSRPADGAPGSKAELRAALDTARTELDHGGFAEGLVPAGYGPPASTRVTDHLGAIDVALAGKAAAAHGHVTAEVTGLQAALDGKADLGHTHTLAQITDAVHANLQGLSADDHPQYLRADGARQLAGALNAGGQAIHNYALAEDTVAGTLALAPSDRGRLKRYTGAGHTWTVPSFGVGEIAVENDGTGAITLSASGVTLSATSIPAGKSAVLRGYAGGAKVKVLVEG